MKIDDHRTNKDDFENIEIAVDSTRVSIYNNNGGHSKLNTRKRKYSGYGQVRKLHVVLNVNDKKAISMNYTSGVAVDYLPVCDMLEEVSDKYNICSIRADVAYDVKSVYKECRKYNIVPIIRLRKDTKICLADYLQLLRGSGRTENRTLEVTEISRTLKNIAKDFAVPVVALSQISRRVEKTKDRN